MKKTKIGSCMERFTVKTATFIGAHKVLYYVLNFTWGLLANIIGGVVFLCTLPIRLPRKKNTFLWAIQNNLNAGPTKIRDDLSYGWGFSLGIFFFVSNGAYNSVSLCSHEFGHSCQNALFGPFHLFLVEIPSAIRFWCRMLQEHRNKSLKTKYDDIWFEGSATKTGANVYNHLTRDKKF